MAVSAGFVLTQGFETLGLLLLSMPRCKIIAHELQERYADLLSRPPFSEATSGVLLHRMLEEEH